jgi:hypothetical protein
VQIFNLNIESELPDILRLSSGTASIVCSDQGVKYDDDARVPLGPWRDVTVSEANELVATLPSDSLGLLVVLLRLPVEMLRILHQLELDEINTMYGSFDEDNDLQRLLMSYIKSLCSVGGDIFFHSLISHPPGLMTVTRDPTSGVFYGLHVDSWDSPPGQDRARAANRITINVGKVDRTFLFVNLTVDEMAREAQLPPTDLGSTSATNIGRRFLAAFPDYPVVGVRLRPGEAYIAPTDNIMHDGSSQDARSTSWHVTVRGHISLA